MSVRFVSFYISASIFLFYALSVSIPSGYGYGALLLLISVFFIKLVNKTERSIPIKRFYFPIAILLGYFCVLLFDVVYHGLPIDFLDNPSRFVFATLVVLVLARSPPSLNVFWAAVIAGAISAGLLALYQKYSLNIDRPNGYAHPIQFGNISILLSFFCLAGLTWVKQQPFFWLWKIFLITGVLFGMLASLLSQSRGGWLAIPIIIMVLIYSQSGVLNAKKITILSSLLLLFFSLLYAVPQTGVKIRIAQALSDIQKYGEGNEQSSLGTRIALWKNAIEITKAKPILGHGELEYLEALKIRVDNKLAPENLLFYSHVHNDYLDALVKRGLIGLLALLLLYGLPLIYFFKHLKAESNSVRSIAQGGVFLMLSYMVFGLSQGFLLHHSGMIILAFSIVIIFSLLHNELQNE